MSDDSRFAPQSASAAAALRPAPLRLDDIGAAIGTGIRHFRAIPLLSVAFAAIFALIGLLLFIALDIFAIAPISLSLAGGFMMIGPILLAGFFALSDRVRTGQQPSARDFWHGFRRMPRGGWVVSFVCALLFLIWITDAGTLYGFMVGREPTRFAHLLRLDQSVVEFVLFSSIMGGVLAFILFTVSAFSIPLLYDHRANLVSGVSASARTVFTRFPTVLAWAAVLTVTIALSALLLPLLLVSLPVMAYASRELYFRAFPPGSLPSDELARDPLPPTA